MLIPLNFLYTEPRPFQFTVNTANLSTGSTSNLQYRLPLVGSGAYNMIVDWGDGTTSTITAWNQPQVTHTYPATGIYNISISGYCNGWQQNNLGDRSKITNISQFGTGFVLSTNSFFYGCNNLQISATDAPAIFTKDMGSGFRACTVFNSNINHWNVSRVTNMASLFNTTNAFNQPLDNWDTSNVTNMSNMFAGAVAFDQPIGMWNTSNVNNMSGMFRKFPGSAPFMVFNQNLGAWDVSKVTTMSGMFQYLKFFNNGESPDINNWNISNLTIMGSMFGNCPAFNQPLNNWNTSNVTNMQTVFNNAIAFNQPLNNWDVSKVNNMSGMFSGATAFNSSLANWNISSSMSNMSAMFLNAAFFDQDLSSWTFGEKPITQGIDCSSMFKGCGAFNNGGQPLTWTIRLGRTFQMFAEAVSFNQNIGTFQFGKSLYDMTNMFYNATSFNNGGSPDINNWNIPNDYGVTVDNMFSAATSFNQPINNLFSIAPIFSAKQMFQDAVSFNQNIGSWKFTRSFYLGGNFTLESMFAGATAFNNGGSPDINNWVFPEAVSMQPYSNYALANMFASAESFNQPIGNWNIFYGRYLDNMFAGAISFNQDLSNWTLGAESTYGMFSGATSFNNGGSSGIQNWYVGGVSVFAYMFAGATSFNQPLTNWVGEYAEDISYMFDGATSFNQDLSNFAPGVFLGYYLNAESFIYNTSFTPENLDNIYNGWWNAYVTAENGPYAADFSTDVQYTIASEVNRDNLINIQGWTITDGGLV